MFGTMEGDCCVFGQKGATLSAMKMHRLLSSILFFSSCAMAQPAEDIPGAADRQSLQAQRRAELRQALLPQRQPAEPSTRQVRQLSPQERRELRQQLQQQHQRETGRAAP